MAEAKWVDGQSILPQPHPDSTIEWVWCNGQSGDIGADSIAAAAPPSTKPYLMMMGMGQ